MPLIKTLTIAASAAAFLTTPLELFAQANCRSALGGYCFQLATVYPGIEFLGDISDIGGILTKLFTWGLAFAALCAFAMITFGGVKYMIAGDNQSMATDARHKMLNAVAGLVLALTSWLILYTINPKLTEGWTVNMPKLHLIGRGNEAGLYACALLKSSGNECSTMNYTTSNCDGPGHCVSPFSDCIPRSSCQ